MYFWRFQNKYTCQYISNIYIHNYFHTSFWIFAHSLYITCKFDLKYIWGVEDWMLHFSVRRIYYICIVYIIFTLEYRRMEKHEEGKMGFPFFTPELNTIYPIIQEIIHSPSRKFIPRNILHTKCVPNGSSNAQLITCTLYSWKCLNPRSRNKPDIPYKTFALINGCKHV